MAREEAGLSRRSPLARGKGGSKFLSGGATELERRPPAIGKRHGRAIEEVKAAEWCHEEASAMRLDISVSGGCVAGRRIYPTLPRAEMRNARSVTDGLRLRCERRPVCRCAPDHSPASQRPF